MSDLTGLPPWLVALELQFSCYPEDAYYPEDCRNSQRMLRHIRECRKLLAEACVEPRQQRQIDEFLSRQEPPEVML